MVATEQISIKRKLNRPVLVSQWSLPKGTLEAAHMLVKEQLDAGHVRESISPWNTPISIIKKKSGKWRLLHDLHAVSTQMEIMGSVQSGLPMISALPRNWTSIVIDLRLLFSPFLCIRLIQINLPLPCHQLIILPLICDMSGWFYPKVRQIALPCASFM